MVMILSICFVNVVILTNQPVSPLFINFGLYVSSYIYTLIGMFLLSCMKHKMSHVVTVMYW